MSSYNTILILKFCQNCLLVKHNSRVHDERTHINLICMYFKKFNTSLLTEEAQVQNKLEKHVFPSSLWKSCLINPVSKNLLILEPF